MRWHGLFRSASDLMAFFEGYTAFAPQPLRSIICAENHAEANART